MATTKPRTTTGSKPDFVKALTKTWRKSAEHFAEQLQRFVRLTVIAAIPSVVNLAVGGKFDWKTLLAFIVPFGEVAYRQVWPALSPGSADSAPGVTIVPSEVTGATGTNGTTAADATTDASAGMPYDPAP